MKHSVACPCLRRRLPVRMKLRSPKSDVWVCADCGGTGVLTPKQQELAEINAEISKLNFA